MDSILLPFSAQTFPIHIIPAIYNIYTIYSIYCLVDGFSCLISWGLGHLFMDCGFYEWIIICRLHEALHNNNNKKLSICLYMSH